MKIRYAKKTLKNGIHVVNIRGFQTENDASKKALKTIIKLLTKGNEYFFHFSNEDRFFFRKGGTN